MRLLILCALLLVGCEQNNTPVTSKLLDKQFVAEQTTYVWQNTYDANGIPSGGYSIPITTPASCHVQITVSGVKRWVQVPCGSPVFANDRGDEVTIYVPKQWVGEAP